MILAANNFPSWVIFLIVLGAAFIIGLIAFILYLAFKPKLKRDDKPTDEQIVEEEMNRVLKPIEDEETAKAVEQYKDEED